MIREILMPKLGLTMVEGTVIQWFANEGDHINVGDRLLEVETDKLTNEIIADSEGILKSILVKPGESAEVQALIGIIAGEGEDISYLQGGHSNDKEVEEITEDINESAVKSADLKISTNSGYAAATPYAKKLAAERGIDLSNVTATGYKGVILAKDIESYDSGEIKIKVTPTARKMAEDKGINLADIYNGTKIRKADIIAMEEKQDTEGETEKAGSMRKIIAQRMKASWAGTPMVTFNMEADMTELINLRERLKPVYARDNLKLTYNHIIMKILSKLLVKYRYLNASFEDDTIIYHSHVNIGVAVDVEKGLMVPNVKGAEKMTLREISSETERITPIINKPEVAILGINKIMEKPVAVNGQVVIRPMMNLSLTTDHSLVDGALSAKFLREIVDIIENPYLLLD